MSQNTPALKLQFSNMPSIAEDFEHIWAYLKSGFDYIMSGQDLSFAGYANLYTTIYNCCRSHRMISGTDSLLKQTHTTYALYPHAEELYRKLSDYFVQHLQPILEKSKSLQNIDLLRYYAAEWGRYTNGARIVHRLSRELNAYWVKVSYFEGRKSVYPIYKLALVQWKSHFLPHVQGDNAKLTKGVLDLITQQRDGELIDQGLVKKVVDSFVSLGLDKSNLDKECLDVYQEQFENAFLQATGDYYKAESEAFLINGTLSDYLKKAEDRLREEECGNALIRAHSELMWENVHFHSLLDPGKVDHLRRMHILLSRIPDSLGPLRKTVEEYIKLAAVISVDK